MTEQEIKTEIEGYINGTYSAWTIGVTDDPDRRKQEHDNLQHWHHWNASTEDVARSIEDHFLDKGCKGAGGGRGDADYVYIF